MQPSSAKERVFSIPLIEIIPPSDHYRGLDAALKRIAEYDWLLFTSHNAVHHFFSRPLAPSAAELKARVASVGPTTTKFLHELDVMDVVTAKAPTAMGLLKELEVFEVKGKRMLFPRAKEGRDELPDGLIKRGALIDVVETYQTIMPRDLDREHFRQCIASHEVDVVPFRSPSAVRHFFQLVEELQLYDDIKVLEFHTLGPTTAAELSRFIPQE